MRKWILKTLKNFIDYLSILHNKIVIKREIELPYNSLSPTDSAEKVEDYLETLEWVLNNKSKIKNIAISGPYGSGKSSVIKTFQKRHEHNQDFKFLNISLATFKEEKKGDKEENCENKDDLLRLIELSILQQLFYHEKDSKIPDSRFKKIRNHKIEYLWLMTIGFLIFVAALLNIILPDFLATLLLLKLTVRNSETFHYISVIIVTLSSIFLVFKSIRILKGLTIKKFGISNASIEIDEKISKSILNNHIDEILYFFEVTRYNIIIIEDLDRFEQTDIFTKLREINLLINNSKKIKKDVVFIYAIRDDMFKDKGRTKFFDFMIPIIPIINSSNSNEKLLKLIQTNKYKISDDLIEDISLFIDDMRLLYNIMNEYHLYSIKLNKTLSQNKLLAMIVYKNIYPSDFTRLSQNEGELYQTITNKHEYIKEEVSKIDNEIFQLKENVKNLKLVNLKDVTELRMVYLAKYIERLTLSGFNFIKFNIEDTDISLLQAVESVNFEFFKNNNAKYSSHRSNIYSNIVKTTTNVEIEFVDIENEVNAEVTYNERERKIINNNYLEELKGNIDSFEKKKKEIKKFKIKDLITNNSIYIKLENQNQQELINVLLRNEYIDEDYHDYISIFYEGSISKNDHQFIINVKTQKVTEFHFPLQKMENILKRINEYEFEKEFIFNFDLLDFLLESSEYTIRRNRFLQQLNNESELVIKFIDEFIDFTANIELFIKHLCGEWTNIWSFVQNKSNYSKEKTEKYFKLIIEYAEVKDINKIFVNSRDKITDNKYFLLIIKNTAKLKDIIKELNIQFNVLDESEPQELLDYVYDNNNYSINIETLRFFLKYKGKLVEKDFETKNYSTIKESELDKLIDYVENNINEYIEFVYLDIQTNTEEREQYYIDLLNNDQISYLNRVKIVRKIDTVINKINAVDHSEIIKLLLEESKILATWNNLIDIYIQNENEFIIEMTSFVNAINNSQVLSKTKIAVPEQSKVAVKAFLTSLLLNDDIDDASYSLILSSIPYHYNSLSFENLSDSKVKLLIGKNKLTTNVTNYSLLKNSFDDLHNSLIENDPDKFINEIDSFEVEANDLLYILKSDVISILHKEKIIANYETTIFTNDSELLTQIGSLLLANSSLIINNEIVLAVGTDSKLILLDKISLFNKWNRIYNKEDISRFLISLEKPYSSIAENGKRPLLDYNDINQEFAENLFLKEYISSYKTEKKKGIRISTLRIK